MTFRIPIDPNGYAVNQDSGTIHTRYPGAHAGQHYRTRTPKGVESLLDGRTPKVCATCYPSPRYPEPPRPPQQRRSGPSKPKKS